MDRRGQSIPVVRLEGAFTQVDPADRDGEKAAWSPLSKVGLAQIVYLE